MLTQVLLHRRILQPGKPHHLPAQLSVVFVRLSRRARIIHPQKRLPAAIRGEQVRMDEIAIGQSDEHNARVRQLPRAVRRDLRAGEVEADARRAVYLRPRSGGSGAPRELQSARRGGNDRKRGDVAAPLGREKLRDARRAACAEDFVDEERGPGDDLGVGNAADRAQQHPSADERLARDALCGRGEVRGRAHGRRAHRQVEAFARAASIPACSCLRRGRILGSARYAVEVPATSPV